MDKSAKLDKKNQISAFVLFFYIKKYHLPNFIPLFDPEDVAVAFTFTVTLGVLVLVVDALFNALVKPKPNKVPIQSENSDRSLPFQQEDFLKQDIFKAHILKKIQTSKLLFGYFENINILVIIFSTYHYPKLRNNGNMAKNRGVKSTSTIDF